MSSNKNQKLTKRNDGLDENFTDLKATLIKGGVGSLSIIGPLFAEVISSAIPKQRLDRVVDFVRILDDKIEDLKEFIKILKTADGLDLTGEAFRQASEAHTVERREYIANLLKNSLTHDQYKHEQKKKLFSTLNELSDSEIILLKYYCLESPTKTKKYEMKHRRVIQPKNRKHATHNVTFHDSYMRRLDRLGLLEYRDTTKSISKEHTHASTLGRVLINMLKIPED